MAEHRADTPAAARPSPVVDKATTVAAVLGAVTLVTTILAAFGVEVVVDEPAVIAAVGGTVALLNVVLPIVAAKRAARQVTPTAAPQDDLGRELVPLEHIDRGAAGAVGEAVLVSDGTGRALPPYDPSKPERVADWYDTDGSPRYDIRTD